MSDYWYVLYEEGKEEEKLFFGPLMFEKDQIVPIYGYCEGEVLSSKKMKILEIDYINYVVKVEYLYNKS